MDPRSTIALCWTALAVAGCGPQPPLAAPTLTAPEQSAELDTPDPTLRWDPVAGAARYEVEVARFVDPDGPSDALADAGRVRRLPSTATSLRIAAPSLTPGHTYAWRVTAFGGGRQATSEPRWFTVRVGGQTVSRADAASRILYGQLVTPTRIQKKAAYIGRSMLLPGATIEPYYLEAARPVHVTRPSWFGWIDDDATALFAHETRYVLVDVVSGEVTVSAREWWPVLDGRSVFVEDDDRADPELVVYSDVVTEPVVP